MLLYGRDNDCFVGLIGDSRLRQDLLGYIITL